MQQESTIKHSGLHDRHQHLSPFCPPRGAAGGRTGKDAGVRIYRPPLRTADRSHQRQPTLEPLRKPCPGNLRAAYQGEGWGSASYRVSHWYRFVSTGVTSELRRCRSQRSTAHLLSLQNQHNVSFAVVLALTSDERQERQTCLVIRVFVFGQTANHDYVAILN